MNGGRATTADAVIDGREASHDYKQLCNPLPILCIRLLPMTKTFFLHLVKRKDTHRLCRVVIRDPQTLATADKERIGRKPVSAATLLVCVQMLLPVRQNRSL